MWVSGQMSEWLNYGAMPSNRHVGLFVMRERGSFLNGFNKMWAQTIGTKQGNGSSLKNAL